MAEAVTTQEITIILHATIHTTDEMRGHAEAGMASTLDRLAEHLESR